MIDTQTQNSQQTENEQIFKTFFNAIDDYIFILDQKGNVILVNDAVVKRLGYTQEELKGKHVLMFHPEERHDEAQRIIGEMLAGKARYCPVPLITKDKELIPVETRVVQGFWNGQSVLFGVSRDISALRASEEKFSKIFEHNPSPMAISSLSTGKIIDVNTHYIEVIGYQKEEIIGKSSNELNLFVDPKRRDVAMQKLKEDGSLCDFEVEVNTKNHQILIGLFSADIIQLQDQTILLTVMKDITEEKTMAKDLVKRANELEKINNVMVGREIKMIEQKKKIEELEKEISQLKGTH
jgi:PAS domain S-box-containing protein